MLTTKVVTNLDDLLTVELKRHKRKIFPLGYKNYWLTVIGYCLNDKGGVYHAMQCCCGNTIGIPANRVGKTKSCGCKTNDILRECRTTHGMTKTRTYGTWQAMISRCDDADNPSYQFYGQRGISVCSRWRKFDNFLCDMGERPEGCYIDRIDTDGNYQPGNCRWASARENNNNRRSNRRIKYLGQNLTISQWSRRTGLHKCVIQKRVSSGWTPREVFETPIKQQANNRSPDNPVCGNGGRNLNRMICFQGETKTLSEWSAATGILSDTIAKRLERGWSVEAALTKTVARRGRERMAREVA